MTTHLFSSVSPPSSVNRFRFPTAVYHVDLSYEYVKSGITLWTILIQVSPESVLMYLSPGDPLLFLVWVYLGSGAGSFQQGALYFLACGDSVHVSVYKFRWWRIILHYELMFYFLRGWKMRNLFCCRFPHSFYDVIHSKRTIYWHFNE